ncbi:hypothetical protein C4573_06075 [Candidatus Woesearchaeota archaeon]|nr:MAG: hypothetical protein C4573_06075 [Candidatus Woesearchaeota archaeon]
MALCETVKLEHVDDHVLDLVINLNRIPQINTLTTCEGHVPYEPPTWPAKDGWIYFTIPEGAYRDLLLTLELFCQERNYFALRNIRSVKPMIESFQIVAEYEPHHDAEMNNLFEKMNDAGKKAYFERAEIRRKEILQGWSDLNALVVQYIQAHIAEDIESLPYR